MEKSPWDNHYKRKKAVLSYPDENLVRLFKKKLDEYESISELIAVDLGCGSGRHIKLFNECGIQNIIGMDQSLRALNVSKNFSFPLVQNDNRKIPLKDMSVDFVIAWGSLHYNHKKDLLIMLNEIRRVLKNNGYIFATLRSSRDTYLKRGQHLNDDIWITDLNDINNSLVSFYNEEELKKYFSLFNDVQYGIIERSLIGDINKIISHWIIQAKK